LAFSHYEVYLLANDLSNQSLFGTRANAPAENGMTGAFSSSATDT